MANTFEGKPDARQSDTVDEQVSRFRPRYRALTDDEKRLHDALKSKAALKDGDRDHMNSSALTVEQTMDICALLRDVKHQLFPEAPY